MRGFGQCEEVVCHPRIVREEKSRKFTINNPDRIPVRVVKIDGCVITKGRRCDYLFIPESGEIEIYVELKGSGILDAIKQIETTIPQVSQDQRKLSKHCYIVTKGVHPSLATKRQKAMVRFRNEFNAALTVREKVATHSLAASPKRKRSR